MVIELAKTFSARFEFAFDFVRLDTFEGTNNVVGEISDLVCIFFRYLYTGVLFCREISTFYRRLLAYFILLQLKPYQVVSYQNLDEGFSIVFFRYFFYHKKKVTQKQMREGRKTKKKPLGL